MAKMADRSFKALLELIRDGEPRKIKVGRTFALVDAKDAAALERHKWQRCSGYAVAVIDGKRVRMHRLIMGAVEGQQVDHADRNKLNNQRSNLRFCSSAENARNRTSCAGASKFKGVSRHKQAWGASIKLNRETRWIGTFPTQREAAAAYDRAAIMLHGEFACTNKSMGLL